MMKIRNSYVKLGLLILLVLILGFVSGFFINKINLFRIRGNLLQLNNLVIKNMIYFQLILFLGLVIVTIKNLIRIKKMYLKYVEEEEDIYDSLERVQESSLATTQVSFILNLIMFALALTEKNDFMKVSIVMFIIIAVYIGVIEIYLINQIKKYDLNKKGNPTDLVFEKHWMNSCDEVEKMIIYKVSYETLKVIKYTLLFVMIALIIFKMKSNTGNFLIILVGMIWCIMILSNFYYSRKIRKTGVKCE